MSLVLLLLLSAVRAVVVAVAQFIVTLQSYGDNFARSCCACCVQCPGLSAQIRKLANSWFLPSCHPLALAQLGERSPLHVFQLGAAAIAAAALLPHLLELLLSGHRF